MLRGALIEYGMNLLGPIPNVVVFQFNPEQLARSFTIAPPATGSTSGERRSVETGQTAAPPKESFTLTAHFSAADDLGKGGAVAAIPRAFGIAPQLAALEKMVIPPVTPGGLIGAAIDAVASAVSPPAQATRTVPREQLPRILFIWGVTRVLPVRVQSLRITEQKFDFLLNPVQAQVELGLEVVNDAPAEDKVAAGALGYSNMVKDTQATLNLAKAVELVVDMIPF